MSPRLRRLLPLVLIAAAAAVGLWLAGDWLTFESLRDNRAALQGFAADHYLWAVLGFVGVYVTIVATSLPGATVASLTGGFLFGLFPGTLYNLIAATLGACLLFGAVRMGVGDDLARRLSAGDGRVARLKAGVDDNQWSVLFLMRLVPAVPFFLANLLPGLWGVPFHRFAVTTFFGIMPGAVVLTSVGAGLGAVFDAGQTPDLSILASPSVLLPVLGLCALAALPLVLKALQRGKAT
jgi:uncharacterized membrane protein YdjX (TVP38/TMEM64 family)